MPDAIIMKFSMKSLVAFFSEKKPNYAHRDRCMEVVAAEKNVDIEMLKKETREILKISGRVEAITMIRKRFHVPLSSAWVFVDKLDNKPDQ